MATRNHSTHRCGLYTKEKEEESRGKWGFEAKLGSGCSGSISEIPQKRFISDQIHHKKSIEYLFRQIQPVQGHLIMNMASRVTCRANILRSRPSVAIRASRSNRLVVQAKVDLQGAPRVIRGKCFVTRDVRMHRFYSFFTPAFLRKCHVVRPCRV